MININDKTPEQEEGQQEMSPEQMLQEALGLKPEIRTMALFTTTPIKMTNPKKDVTLKLVPVNNKAKKAPVAANGTENIMTKGVNQDSNWATITR